MQQLPAEKLVDQFIRMIAGQISPLMEPQVLSARSQKLILITVLLVCAMLRLPATSIPALDRTMWKEIDYIEISRNYLHHGFHFFSPEISWPAEQPRVTAMEFPLVPFAAAWLYQFFGYHALVVRLISFAAFLAMPIYLFLLVRTEMGPLIGLAAAATAGLMPIHHPFGRILFSEPCSIALCVAALYYFSRWSSEGSRWQFAAAALCYTLAVAMKLEPLFLLLPLLYLWRRNHPGLNRIRPFLLFVSVILVLPIAWFLYAYHLSRTSIDVFGVVPFLHGHNKLQTIAMMRRPQFWLTLGYRIFNLNWALPGAILAALGVLTALAIRKAKFFWIYSLAVFIYFLIVAEGQLDAPYRQLNAVPVLSVFTALGAVSLASLLRKQWMSNQYSLVKAITAASLVMILLVFVSSYVQIFRAGSQQPAHPKAWLLAEQLRKISRPGDRLIMLGEYSQHIGGNDLSPVIYYYSGLQGWTLQPNQFSLAKVESLIGRGATLLAVEPEFIPSGENGRDPAIAAFLPSLLNHYPVLYQANGSLILRLNSIPTVLVSTK